MIILGYTVTPEVEAACLWWMREGWFSAHGLATEVEMAAKIAGHSSIAYRVADRLIQRERKAGHIVRAGKGWVWK